MIKLLLSIAARGGLKVGSIILTVTIFTALAVAMNTMSQSYGAQAPILRELGGAPTISISNISSKGSVSFRAFAQNIGDEVAVILASQDIASLVKILQIEFDGTQPGPGQALVGKGLAHRVSDSKINISGHIFAVVGIIKYPSYLSRAVIVTSETIKSFKVDDKIEAYFGTQATLADMAVAPAIRVLVEGVTGEALSSLSSITYLLYALLAIASSILGYTAMVEAKPTFRIFSILSASRIKMAFTLVAFSTLVGTYNAALGYGIGVFVSALISSTVSLVAGLPHIKPVVDAEILPVLFLGFAAGTISLAVGLIKGYTRCLDNS